MNCPVAKGIPECKALQCNNICGNWLFADRARTSAFPRAAAQTVPIAVGVLACLLAAVASYSYVDIRGLEIKPGDVEGQLLKIESWRAAGIEGFLNIHGLVDRLLGHLPRAGKQENHNLQQGGDT